MATGSGGRQERGQAACGPDGVRALAGSPGHMAHSMRLLAMLTLRELGRAARATPAIARAPQARERTTARGGIRVVQPGAAQRRAARLQPA